MGRVFTLRRAAGCAALAAAICGPPVAAADAAPGAQLADLAERMRAQQAELRTLVADFTQLKESQLLLEPSEAMGTFSYAAPDRVRWEYSAPDPISLLIEGERMVLWYRDLERAEEADIGRHSQRVLRFMGAGTSIDTLLEYFRITLRTPEDAAQPYELELLPEYPRVAKRLQHMELWIDRETLLPVRIRYVEADGDATEYRFSNLRVNDEIPPDRFELELPSGVAVRTIDLDGKPGA